MFTINTLILPDPELGDTIEYNPRLNIKASMSGVVRTTRRTPVIRNRSYTFRAIRLPEVDTLKQMLVTTKDQVWSFIDYNGNPFTGKVVNEVTFIQVGYDCPEFDFTLEIA